jgi:hypothetical protein
MSTCKTLFEQLLAACVENLDKSYDLVYVSYDDKLTDDQVAWLLADDYESLWESTAEWESDQRWATSREIAAGVLKETAECMWRQGEVPEAEDEADDGYLDSEDLWDQFVGSNEYDELLYAIQDRDASKWLDELISHTGGVLLRIPLAEDDQSIERASGYEDEWPTEIESLLAWGIATMPDRTDARAVEAWLADPQVEANAAALRAVWREIGDPVSGFIDYKWPFLLAYVDLADLVKARREEGVTHVELEDPHLLLTNIFEGDGHEEQLTGWVRVPVERLMTDDSAPGYSWDSIAGVHKPAYTCELRTVTPTITTEEKAA